MPDTELSIPLPIYHDKIRRVCPICVQHQYTGAWSVVSINNQHNVFIITGDYDFFIKTGPHCAAPLLDRTTIMETMVFHTQSLLADNGG